MKSAKRGQRVLERLVHVTSEDGFTLAGCLFESENLTAGPLFVWVHGTSLGFAEPEYVAIGRAVARLGGRFLCVETRGHNFGAWLRGPGGTRLAGSAWEYLAEAPMDLGPWRRFAQGLGSRQILFAGHGWGAAKIVYDLAERGTAGIDGVVFASAGSLVRDQLDPSLASEATRLVEAGQGWQLLPWGTRPGMAPNTVSAQSYAQRTRVHRELYGNGGIQPALARVDVPILAWFGDSEGRTDGAIDGFFAAMRRNAVAAPSLQTTILRSGSFLYTGIESDLAGRLMEWSAAIDGAVLPMEQAT
jgi:hypothetical protein